MLSKSKDMLFEVASGDISFANAKNCAQFFTPRPQSLRPTELPAGHATEKCTSRLIGHELVPSGDSPREKTKYLFN